MVDNLALAIAHGLLGLVMLRVLRLELKRSREDRKVVKPAWQRKKD